MAKMEKSSQVSRKLLSDMPDPSTDVDQSEA